VGQIGSELVPALRALYGKDAVIAAGHHTPPSDELRNGGPYIQLDTTNKADLLNVVKSHGITEIYHLASLLSASSEKSPDLAWSVNVDSLKNVLDVAVECKCRVFWPSSIGAFGPTTPRVNTPQSTVLEPTSMYGVTKVSGELLCNYYFHRYGVDVRSLRFPGIISWKTPPGGGTTDYSVAIFYGAISDRSYTCYLKESTFLPMMYMDDSVEAIISLMQAPSEKISVRTSYNITAFSLCPKDLVELLMKKNPGFKISYEVDPVRQRIADSWPDSIDDSSSAHDWGWKAKFDLERTADEMLANLSRKLGSSSS